MVLVAEDSKVTSVGRRLWARNSSPCILSTKSLIDEETTIGSIRDNDSSIATTNWGPDDVWRSEWLGAVVWPDWNGWCAEKLKWAVGDAVVDWERVVWVARWSSAATILL